MEVGQGIYHRLTLFWAGHLMHGPKGLVLHLRMVVVQHRQSAKGFGWLETWNLGAEKLLEEVKSEESLWSGTHWLYQKLTAFIELLVFKGSLSMRDLKSQLP